jgi:hypothetical protein
MTPDHPSPTPSERHLEFLRKMKAYEPERATKPDGCVMFLLGMGLLAALLLVLALVPQGVLE